MEIYKDILDCLSSGVMAFSKDGNIIYINPMAKKILHIYEPLENTNYRESLCELKELIKVIDDMVINNKTVRRSEVKIKQSNFYLTLGYSSMQLKDSSQNHKGYIIIFQDLSILYENR